jgi:hypothetical protein
MNRLRAAFMAFVSMVGLDLAITLYALELRSGFYEANALPAALVEAFGVWGLFVPPVLAVSVVLLTVRGIHYVGDETLCGLSHVPVLGCVGVYGFIVVRNLTLLL